MCRCMHHRIHVCVVFLAAFAVLPAARAAQTCTQKFAGLTTCTLFNGQFATGGETELTVTTLIDTGLMVGYEKSNEIRKTDECKALYITTGCIGATLRTDFPAARPCNNTGARLKWCKGVCVKFFTTCSTVAKTSAEVETHCAGQSVAAGEECFGDAGVLGMKSAEHSPLPPAFVVAFLALATCLV